MSRLRLDFLRSMGSSVPLWLDVSIAEVGLDGRQSLEAAMPTFGEPSLGVREEEASLREVATDKALWGVN